MVHILGQDVNEAGNILKNNRHVIQGHERSI